MGSIFKPKYKDQKTGEIKEAAVWHIKYYDGNGTPIRHTSGTTSEKEAKRILKQKEGRVADGKPVVRRMDRVKLTELLEGVVAEYERNSRASVKDVKSRINNNIKPYFQNFLASQITTPELDKYVDFRLKETTRRKDKKGNPLHPAPATINRELAIIKRAFNLAVEAGQLTFAPKFRMLKENNVRKGFYEQDDFDRALEAVGLREYKGKMIPTMTPEHADVVRDFVRFKELTGWRSQESKDLEWRYVDFTVGRIYIPETKNGDSREFPFIDDLEEILKRRLAYTRQCELREPGDKKMKTVFHRGFFQKGEKQGQERVMVNCERSWLSACKYAGIGEKVMHDFRRTALRNFRRSDINDKVAMQMSGHKTRSVYDRYSIVDEQDIKDFAKKLNRARNDRRETTGKVAGKVDEKVTVSEIPTAVNS